MISSDEIRALFSVAISDMYKTEVPQYADLLEIVAEINSQALSRDRTLHQALADSGELARLTGERHGAIRLGTPQELATMRRLFAVLGMEPVGYYDLAPAGIPVHATGFRPIGPDALRTNPFRMFTSLLRVECIEDENVRAQAQAILARRDIFRPRLLTLIDRAEDRGLTEGEARELIAQALTTFKWHGEASISAELYARLHAAHRLVADVVSFKGPHINHLTPRTLDIDAAQALMRERGLTPKAVIEGPPHRSIPILLRQTSFKALDEPIAFRAAGGGVTWGRHTARFGEIEQRGVALTRLGRELYDRLLQTAGSRAQAAPDGSNAGEYERALDDAFREFPDSIAELAQRDLAFFRYRVTPAGRRAAAQMPPSRTLTELLEAGHVACDPIVYQDFLPGSAAGIFLSNLGDRRQPASSKRADRSTFEHDLGAPVIDEFALYASAQDDSLTAVFAELRLRTERV